MKALAGFLIVLACVHAQTVERYQQSKSKAPDEPEAGFTEIYIDGIGDGLEIANAYMFGQILMQFRPSTSQLKDMRLFCQPPKLALTIGVLKSVLDSEIDGRLKRAAGDQIRTQDVMHTPLASMLLLG